jgi:hypothetical protein
LKTILAGLIACSLYASVSAQPTSPYSRDDLAQKPVHDIDAFMGEMEGAARFRSKSPAQEKLEEFMNGAPPLTKNRLKQLEEDVAVRILLEHSGRNRLRIFDTEPQVEPAYRLPLELSSAPGKPWDKHKQQQQIVPDQVHQNLANPEAQNEVASDFCGAQKPQPCSKAITSAGAGAVASVQKRPTACRQAQAAIAGIDDFNKGNADTLQASQLQKIALYYQLCTTENVPPSMLQVLGIIVDTNASGGEPATGVMIGGKRYAPIGMAVQIAPDRIYTARHVLFSSGDKSQDLKGPRTLSALFYLPFAAPAKALKIEREIRPAGIAENSSGVVNDQAVLELVTSFSPDNVLWPLVRRMELPASGVPTRLYIAGFHAALARSKAPDALHLPGSWTHFIRRDGMPTCSRITQNDDGCMLHGCDTVGGLSGAPVFADGVSTDGGRPVVIGVHRGSAFSLGNAICSAGTQGKKFNMAIVPNPAFFQQ